MAFKRLMPGPEWLTRAAGDSIVAEGIARKIKTHTANKIMTYVTGTPDGAPTSVGILRISIDYGETWANATMLAGCDGCLDVVEGPNDELWGLFYDSSAPGAGAGYTAKVGVSTNGGSSWTLKKTHTAGHQAFNLAVSAERGSATRVAFLARNAQGSPGGLGTAYELVISTNAGTTWNTKNIGVVSMEDTSDVPLVHFAPGRVIVYMPGDYSSPSGDSFYANLRFSLSKYSVSGDTWTPVVMDADFDQFYDLHLFAQGQNIFGAGRNISGGDDVLWESADGGATWTQHAIPAPNWVSIWVDASGRIWGLFDTLELHMSSDRGVTWTLMYIQAPGVSVSFDASLIGHPTDPDKIALLAGSGTDNSLNIAVSTDGFATWNVGTVLDVFPEVVDEIGVTWLDDDTITAMLFSSGVGPPWYAQFSQDFDHVIFNPVTGGPTLANVVDAVRLGATSLLFFDDNDIAAPRVLRGDGTSGSLEVVDPLFGNWIGAFGADAYIGNTSADVIKIANAESSWSPVAVASPGGNLRGFSRTY